MTIPPEIWAVLQSGGVGLIPILGFMWWRAEQRADRAELREQAERNKQDLLARETITAMVKMDTTLKSVISIFPGGRQQIS